MLDVTKTNDLSFYNDQGILSLSAKQYDTGRKFVFNIVNDYELCDLTGYSVYLRMLKADDTQFQGEECCTIDGSKIIIDTSVGNGDQILSCAGKNIGEIHLTDSEGKSLTTWDFIINVMPRVHNGDHIDSDDSFDSLDNILEDIIILNINFDKHINNKENPHEVTKKQVGLENVDNTSDEDKPVSKAQKEALDTKVDSVKIGETECKSGTVVTLPVYTTTEIDNKFSAFETGIDWKEAVETYVVVKPFCNTLT